MDFFVRFEKHIEANDGKEALEKASELDSDCIIGIATCPYDLVEQAKEEEIRKVSLEDMDDAFLIDALRDRGYMLQISCNPKVAHFDM